jgi:hypothetical protein
VLPDPQRSRAVLIGVDSYRELDPVPAVAPGTRRLSKLLRDLWGVPKSHVTALGAGASAHQVLGAVRDAAQATRDTLVVYFAGHGLRDLDGRNLYLCLADADPNHPQVGTVAYKDLRDVLRQAGHRARYRLTFLDCCYSGLAGAMSAHGLATREELALALDEDPAPESDPTEEYGDVVLTSAPHDKQSFSPPDADCPEATGELIKVLTHGIPGMGSELSVSLVWRQVRRGLVSRGRPEPQLYAQNYAAELLGFPNRAPAAVAALPGANGPARRFGADSPEDGEPDRTDMASAPPADPSSVPEPDWQPSPIVRWRPEKETPYPGSWYFKDQRECIFALDDAWAELKKEFKEVRRRLRVPFHVRSPVSTATWLYLSTGDSRWMIVARSLRTLEDRRSGYTQHVPVDPYAGPVPSAATPPTWKLTADHVDSYREKVEQLRADINKLAGLHSDVRE